MVTDHSYRATGNRLPPHGLLFPINSKGYFIWSSHRQNNTYNGLYYTNVEHWLEPWANAKNGDMSDPNNIR